MFHNVRFKELEAIMAYIYNGEVSVPDSEINSFLKVAESLQISGISCGMVIPSNITHANQNMRDKVFEDSVPEYPADHPLEVENKILAPNVSHNKEGAEMQDLRKSLEKDDIDGLIHNVKPHTPKCKEKKLPQRKQNLQISRKSIKTSKNKIDRTSPSNIISKDNNIVNCPKCGKSYKHKRSFHRHLKYECGVKERSFNCEICGSKYFRKDTLRSHISVKHLQNNS